MLRSKILFPQTPITDGGDQSRPLVGILLVISATLSFALSDVLTKYLTQLYPVSIVVAVRYIINVALLLLFMGPRLGTKLWHTERTLMVFLRALCLTAASLTMAMAFQIMPVGETIAIMYLSPFLVMVLAIPLLGEKVTPVGWIAALLGFSGVLLIIRPGSDLPALGVALALANAGCATAYLLFSRVLAKRETTWAMLFYTSFVGMLVFCAMAVPDLGGAMPEPLDMFWMLLLGVVTLTGHYFLTAAYREAPASMLAPVNYAHLVWAGVLGFLVFGDIPQWLNLIGMALIAFAGAGGALYAHFNRRKQ